MVRVLADGPVTVTASAWDVAEDGRIIGRISVKDGQWFAWSSLGVREWSAQTDRGSALAFVQDQARAFQPTLMGA